MASVVDYKKLTTGYQWIFRKLAFENAEELLHK